ncbi:MAG TPA: hypothetical protein VJQ47_14480 [Steroidobacteraceae bacterium]|nr:hypothetical protein [Steroidobacteraceae bacterium]
MTLFSGGEAVVGFSDAYAGASATGRRTAATFPIEVATRGFSYYRLNATECLDA